MKSLLSPPEQAMLIGNVSSLCLSCLVFVTLLTQKYITHEVQAVIATSTCCAGHGGCLHDQTKHEMMVLQVPMSAAAGLQSRQERRVPYACAFRVCSVWFRGDSSSPV